MNPTVNKTVNIGLALSGGGARGIAHMGVIKALEENGIVPQNLTGASAGAIVGTLYAAGYSPDEMIKFVKEASIFKAFKVTIPDKGFTKITYIRERLSEFISEDSFESLQKKLFIAICNLNTGKTEFRSQGNLFDVVMASAAIPLVFKPVQIEGEHYVDGGLMENLPIPAAFEKASDFIIGVNVMPEIAQPERNFSTFFSVATRCFELSILGNSNESMKKCDVLISPEKVYKYHLFQFNRYQKLYEIGYEEAMAAIPKIKSKLHELSKK